jgi:hypothetical protein
MSGLCFAIIRAIAMRPQTVPVGFLLPIIGFIYGPIHIGIEFRRGRLEPLRLGELVWVLQLVAVFGVFPVGFLVFSELQDLQGRLGAWGPVSGLLLIIIGFPAAVAFAVFELALPFLCILGLVTYLLPKVDDSPVLWTEVAGFVFGIYGLVPLGIMCEVLALMP